MLDKVQLERILTINGVSPTESDEVIRELLMSARYSEQEVELALSVLRENTTTHDQTIDSTHKIFRNDSVLSPADITKLLGIDVEVGSLRKQDRPSGARITAVHFCLFGIIGVSILVCSFYIYSDLV